MLAIPLNIAIGVDVLNYTTLFSKNGITVKWLPGIGHGRILWPTYISVTL